MKRLVPFSSAALLAGMVFLQGCGSPPPPPPSVEKEISAAKNALAAADSSMKVGNYSAALDEYNRALDTIKTGLTKAGGLDESRLKQLQTEARNRRAIADEKRLTARAQAPAVTAGPSGSDIAAKEKKEAEAKKKAEADAAAAEKARTDALLAQTQVAAAKPGKTKEEDVEAAPKTAGKGGEKAAEADAAADSAADANAIAKKDAHFPAVTPESPEIDIVKMETRDGKYLLAYVQVFNKANAGFRLHAQPAVFFKDGNSNTLGRPEAVMTFQYDGFNPKAKDPTEQSCPAITNGSHAVDGMGVLRFVAVLEHPQAATCKTVGVAVRLGEKRLQATGPRQPVAQEGIGIGIKLK